MGLVVVDGDDVRFRVSCRVELHWRLRICLQVDVEVEHAQTTC